MKKRKLFIVGLIVYPILFAATSGRVVNQIEETIEVEPKPIATINPIDELVSAMIMVESGGNDSAIGDRHLGSQYAVGALQIRPIMVKEVNRILKLRGSDFRFELKDRYDRDKSIDMFLIWYEFHHNDSNFEAIARTWNGGTNGVKNPKTYNYWKKVQNELASLR